MSRTVDAHRFYSNYYGHPLDQIDALYNDAKSKDSNIIWLAGDSSLDNKHWLYTGDKNDPAQLYDGIFTDPAPRQFALLQPQRSVKDVAFWLNTLQANQNKNATVLNLAVEESTLSERENSLTEYDIFIRDHISENDILIVSIGGNDIALKPSMKTVFHMSTLLSSPLSMIERGSAPGLQYFRHMFKDDVERYVVNLTGKVRPRKVLVCMIYYPDENGKVSSWANTTLALMGYNRNPTKMQTIIKKTYDLSTTQISVPGTMCVPVPLFDVLNGKDTTDYKHRVEPSVTGGHKMALLFDTFI